MTIRVNWANPYANRAGAWLKGNLHTHTSPASGCASVPLAVSWDSYSKAGYDFLSISDHMILSRPPDDRMIWIPGLEWNNASGCHTGIYSTNQGMIQSCIGITDHEVLLQACAAIPNMLVVLNHPNWQLIPHYRREALQAASVYDGIEIYNHVITRLAGNADSTDKWDYLLDHAKRRVLGFATDDSHNETETGCACVVVRAPERKAASILNALQEGNFYSSCGGLWIADVGREGDRISVHAPEAEEIHAVADGGCVIGRTMQPGMTLDLGTLTCGYVRFVLYGRGSSMAWTQPFFKEAAVAS